MLQFIQQKLASDYGLRYVPDSFVLFYIEKMKPITLGCEIASAIANDWQRGLRLRATIEGN